MSDVPSDVHCEILKRLPAESLLRFRSVCKAWCRIIDDPSFIKTHTNIQQSPSTLVIRDSKGDRLYSLSLDSLNFVDGHQTIDVTPIKQLILHDLPTVPFYLSCNGLILIYDRLHREINKIWAIWNPLTQKFHKLPQVDADLRVLYGGPGYEYIGIWNWGFGYDYAADDYKVVRIDKLYRNLIAVYRVIVYSLNLGSWRRIKDCPYDIFPYYGGVFLKGALHFRARDVIIVLDLGTEDYRQLLWPTMHTRPMFESEHLDELGGCLVLSYYLDGRFDGWIMKEYGVENSWMKLFSIEHPDLAFISRLRPVAYFKIKSQVLLQGPSGFFWLDVENNSVKKVTVHGLSSFSFSQFSPGSLFRLDDSGNVSQSVVAKTTAGVKRNRERAHTRLKFCVRNTEVQHCSDDGGYSSDLD